MQLAKAHSVSGFTAFPDDQLLSMQPCENYNSIQDSISDVDVYEQHWSTIAEWAKKTELVMITDMYFFFFFLFLFPSLPSPIV